MKYHLCLGIFIIFCGTAFGQDLPKLHFHAFLEYAELGNSGFDTDREIDAGVGFAWDFTESHQLVGEIYIGPYFKDTNSGITYFGWDLDWQGSDLLYRYRRGSFEGFAGVGYAELVEENRIIPTTVKLEHHGNALQVGAGWSFAAKATLFFRYRRFVSSLEAPPRPRPRFLADQGDPEIAALGIRWQFR